MTNIFSFGKNQKYYTTAKKVIDAIVGFIVGWMGFGFGLWSGLSLLFGIVVLAISGTTMYYERKWLGIGMLIGGVCTTLFFFYATRVLGL